MFEGGGDLALFYQLGAEKFAKNLLLLSRFVHDCPLLDRKLESGLKTKIPRKSKNYKGFMWWPGTELNRRHGDFQSPVCLLYMAVYQSITGATKFVCALYVQGSV